MAMAVLGLMVMFGGSAAAQGLSGGVRGGLNLASVTFDGGASNPSLDSRPGLVGGVFVTLPIVSWVKVQPEVLFSRKGARLDEDGVDAALVLDYLEVPVLARVSGNAFGSTRFYVVAGPTVGFNVQARSRTVFGGSTEEIDITDDIERMDIGVAAGAGLEFRSMVIDGRYTLGLSDIDKDKTDAVKSTNRVFSLTAGFRF